MRGQLREAAAGPSTQAGPTTTVHVAKVATNEPSISAKMVCEPEAVNDIYAAARPASSHARSKPTWVNHVYSCDYMYPGGAKMTLSVKEVSNEEQTTAYFDDRWPPSSARPRTSSASARARSR